MNDWLVCAPSVEVVEADDLHIALFSARLARAIGARNNDQCDEWNNQLPHEDPPFFVAMP